MLRFPPLAPGTDPAALGVNDSGDRIREIAEAYQRGEDPFEVRDFSG